MSVDALHALVSGAIWRAEQLDTPGVPTASSAWSEVSSLEEKLADALPVKDAEGRIAKRGAVRAALKAGDHIRAQALADSFLSQRGVPRPLRKALRDMLEASGQDLCERFPAATKHHKISHLRSMAYRLHTNGPFWLAAHAS